MRHFTKVTLFMAMSAISLASCSDESPWSGPSDEGAVKLNFSSDSRVMRQTRADDSQSPVVPDANAFGVSLVKSDGSYSKRWSGVEAFNREKSFPIGDYTITASYGDIDVEGFDNPYYSGSNQVHVSPGATTDVSVTATLANAMVSIRYTDAFREIYSAYSAAVQTTGHDWLIFASTEDRPAYIAPCADVKLNLTLTNGAGEKVTIQPASFAAQARHHYVVTIGVNGSVTAGDLALDVQFDDDVVAETVNVPLGDDLFTAPAPTLTPKGFTPETTIGKFEYAVLSEDPQFHIIAFGGLKSATLNVIAENGYTPSFGRTVEFVNADDLTLQHLKHDGVAGYIRNFDKMGVIDVKEFLEKLPAGKYTLEVQAVDLMTRTTEPLRLTAEIIALEISLAPVAQTEFMGDEVAVDLTTNSPDIKDVVAFKVPDANNKMVDAVIKSVTEVTAAGGAGHLYRYVLALAPSFRSEIDVEVSLKANRNKTAQTKVLVNAPEYTITPDAFSNRVVLKIESDRPEIVKTLVDNLQFFNGSNQVPTANITHDSANGMVTVSGLTPALQYVALKAVCGTFEKTVPEFTTEAETDVPNGGFEHGTQTINLGVQVGGKWHVTLFSSHVHNSTVLVSEPTGWASINQKTCWSGAANLNSWFVVPSTMMENGITTIRSVGYSHNGKTPSETGSVASTTYYNTNSPSDAEFDKSAGELFLGSYSYDSSGEDRVDGIAFASRPLSVSFDYEYSSVNNEKGEVYIAVYDKDNNVINEKIEYLSTATAGMVKKNIELDKYDFGKKAAKLVLCFKSTQTGVSPTINIPTGSALNEGTGLESATIAANQYKAVAIGSKLRIDNVKFGYEAPGASTPASKRRR